MRDIQIVLERWGAWAANDNSHIDWPHIAAGFKGLLPITSKTRPQCCDEEGIIIDGCIARLKKYSHEEFELIILHYVYNISLRKISKKRKCSDGTIRKDMQTAQGFICGVLLMVKSGGN